MSNPAGSATRVKLRVVELRSVNDKPVWLNLDSIKSFATVEVSPDIEIPDGAVVAQTLITLKGEGRALKVDGTPEELLNKLRNGVTEF